MKLFVYLSEDVTGLPQVMTTTKAVRFIVEFPAITDLYHTSAGYVTLLVLTQEKGALSTFKLIYNHLRRDWDFDVPLTPVLCIVPSPVFSGGSYTASPFLG